MKKVSGSSVENGKTSEELHQSPAPRRCVINTHAKTKKVSGGME